MPWRCPACHVPIQHNEFEVKPREGVRYRCHICRLELMFDRNTDKLTVTPLISEPESETEERAPSIPRPKRS
jgi:hypothetical protein